MPSIAEQATVVPVDVKAGPEGGSTFLSVGNESTRAAGPGRQQQSEGGPWRRWMMTYRAEDLLRAGLRILALAFFIALPIAIVMWLVPATRDLDRAALVHELVVYPSVLVGGMLLYVCWRLAHNETTAWLTAVVTLVGVQGLGVAAIRIAQPGAMGEHAGWLAGIDLAVQTLMVVMAANAARRALTVDPLLVAVVGGVLVTVARMAALGLPTTALTENQLRGLALVLFAGQVLTAALVLRLPHSPRWLRARIGVVAVVLGLSHLMISPYPANEAGNGVAIGLGVLGTAVLLDAAYMLLKVLLQRQRSTVRSLHDRVEHLEAGVRIDRARLHEIGTTLAGIANASTLLHHESFTMTPDRRRALERAVDSEAARLLRLMDKRHVARPEETDLDALLEPVVTAHRERGRVVHWESCGLKASCRPDDIAEVVNILLENAAQHAGTGTELTVRRVGSSIRLHVSDQGPGIPPDVAGNLFAWGRRGPGSNGQGIGLHIAHRLMTEQGGDLVVLSCPGAGTTFVASLPEASEDWGDADDGGKRDA